MTMAIPAGFQRDFAREFARESAGESARESVVNLLAILLVGAAASAPECESERLKKANG
ncbi:hypothetical protein OU994_09505 [Pseudoduganella sp. SL102]|uniref:hypothetical protein n=1 Tax=Pseudoduganella sp. SL102 TaxID=2995154 RepID=UPI00248D32A4|nr:hypothetical protein [Pseudoduganella sp. SL102]WBS04494.1 hypothetical protein OU994_09505 [Pseudoduganella sp. SL102]